MERNDHHAIESLFAKLANVERDATPRDPEAESYIRQMIGKQPGAPYYMAQTIIVQEQALEAAQARIENLEEQLRAGPADRQRDGGLLSGLFSGDDRPPARSGVSVPRVGRSAAASREDAPAYQQRQRRTGGFLAGAAQTAMGVAGGVLLGNAIAGMFDGNEAQAADKPDTAQEAADTKADDVNVQDANYDDAGFDDGGGFDDIDI